MCIRDRLAALAVLGLARRITVPLTELTTSAGHFANGEFDWPVPHDTRGDEVGVMARALERARDSIRLQLDQIGRYAAEQQKLRSELDIAHGIQMSMLPHDRDFDSGERRYRLQARLEPVSYTHLDVYKRQPIASAPPLPPSPITVQMIGTLSSAISIRLRAIASD